jgi:hypothetical protein
VEAQHDNDDDDDDNNNNNNNNNNSIQFFIIYVPSQQPQGQLQTEHRVDTSNYIMDKIIIIIIIIIIQFNSCLFTCKLNSTEANYKVRTRT